MRDPAAVRTPELNEVPRQTHSARAFVEPTHSYSDAMLPGALMDGAESNSMVAPSITSMAPRSSGVPKGSSSRMALEATPAIISAVRVKLSVAGGNLSAPHAVIDMIGAWNR